jgi:hypothetical protein
LALASGKSQTFAAKADYRALINLQALPASG